MLGKLSLVVIILGIYGVSPTIHIYTASLTLWFVISACGLCSLWFLKGVCANVATSLSQHHLLTAWGMALSILGLFFFLTMTVH